MTEELLVHAGINHQLALFYAFPHLPASNYDMRHTGNRGLEAIHGIFRGGAASLPITAPNLSFREFLAKMNQTNQIHTAEHNLKQIEGHTVVASKKKRKTCAKSSEDSPSSETYILPQTFKQFCKELEDACKEGDKDSKKTISKLAPDIEKCLKKAKQWDKTDLPISPSPTDIQLLKTLESGEVSTPDSYTADEIELIISSILGPIPKNVDAHTSLSSQPDIEQAYANCDRYTIRYG